LPAGHEVGSVVARRRAAPAEAAEGVEHPARLLDLRAAPPPSRRPLASSSGAAAGLGLATAACDMNRPVRVVRVGLEAGGRPPPGRLSLLIARPEVPSPKCRSFSQATRPSSRPGGGTIVVKVGGAASGASCRAQQRVADRRHHRGDAAALGPPVERRARRRPVTST
jgi:hypothetical protein